MNRGQPDDEQSPCRRAHGSSSACYRVHGAMLATGACASGATPLSQGTRHRTSSAAQQATGARASSTAPLSFGIIQAAGSCTSVVAPLSLGTGTHASSAVPPGHTPRMLHLHVAPFN